MGSEIHRVAQYNEQNYYITSMKQAAINVTYVYNFLKLFITLSLFWNVYFNLKVNSELWKWFQWKSKLSEKQQLHDTE